MAASADAGAPAAADPAQMAPLRSIVAQLGTRAVRDRLDTLKVQNLKLLEHNSKLKGAISDMGSHQTDVYVYIHEKLDEYSDQIAAYEARVAELEAETVRLREERDHDVNQGRADAEQEILRLTTQLDALTDELAQVQEFQAEREEVLRDRDELRESLESERRGREEDRAAMERTKIAEKQRLKDEMLRRVQEAKNSILADQVQQLRDTTKRTLAENEQMTTELAYQSRAVEDLLKRVSTLETQRDTLRRRLALRESEADALTRRNHALEQMMNALRRAARAGQTLQAASPRGAVAKDGPATSRVTFGADQPAAPAPVVPAPRRPPSSPPARPPRSATASAAAPSAAAPAAASRASPRPGAAALAAERRRARTWERRYVDLSERLRRALASRDALVSAMGEGLVVLSGVLQAPARARTGRGPVRGAGARRLLDMVEAEGRARGPAAALALVVGGIKDAVRAADEAGDGGGDGAAGLGAGAAHSLLVRSVLGDDAQEAHGWADAEEGKDGGLWSSSAGDLEAPSLLSLPSTADAHALTSSASAAEPPSAPTRPPAAGTSSLVDFQRSSAASAVRMGRRAGDSRTHGVATLGRSGGQRVRLSASASTVAAPAASEAGMTHQASTADAAVPNRAMARKPRAPSKPRA